MFPHSRSGLRLPHVTHSSLCCCRPYASRNPLSSAILLTFLLLAAPRYEVAEAASSFANIVDDSWYTRGASPASRYAARTLDSGNAAFLNAVPATAAMDACNARTAPFLNETRYPRPPIPTLCPAEAMFEVCDVKGPIRFNITPTFIGTRWKGWGTSLAWFGNYVGGFPDKRLKTLMDLIFRKSGLGFNIARYNIGGGYNVRFSPQFQKGKVSDWRGVPGFRFNPSGPYNWKADRRQKAVLRGARDRGANIFEAFSNSPPWWMTYTRDVAGSKTGTATNLRPEYESAFGQYLAAVVERFAKDPNWNLTFDSVEPFNEPLEGFWKAGAPHEGCSFQPPEMGRVIQKTTMALKSKGLKTKLVGVDSWSDITGHLLPKIAGSKLLQRINVHSYLGTPPDGVSTPRWTNLRYAGIRKVAKKMGKEVWVSEGGPIGYGGHPYDVTLYVARQVIESINILEASAYVYWQAVDPHPAWTLIKVPWDYPIRKAVEQMNQKQGPVLTKRYWIFKQFAKYAKQGSRPLRVPYSCWHSVAAFYNEKDMTVSAFFVNQKAKAVPVNFGLDGFQINVGNPTRVIRHRTTWDESYGEALISVGKTAVTVTLRGQSFVSVVFTNIALKKPSKKRLRG